MRWTYRFLPHTRVLIARWLCTLLLLLTALPGCVHRVEVNPVSSHPASSSIPRSLQVGINSLTIQGADHMPGITLLEWRTADLSRATREYIRNRGTFVSVSEGPADLTLKLTARLSMIARGPYVYRVRLQADMGTAREPIKSYDVERSAKGSSVRWITSSDRDPIEAALQLALEDLLTNIESDRSLYLAKEPVRSGKP